MTTDGLKISLILDAEIEDGLESKDIRPNWH